MTSAITSMSMSMTSTTNVSICVHLCPSVAECFFLGNELRNDHRTRGARAIKDAVENVLQVSGRVWGRGKFTSLPRLSRFAGRLASDERGSSAFYAPNGTYAGVRYCRYLEI